MASDVLKTLLAEAYGEGPEGMRLVAETILNRAAIRGLTPEQVVNQPAQYTGLAHPGAAVKKTWNDPQALAAAQAAWDLALQPGDPTRGADHYYAQGTIDAPWWASSMSPRGQMGGHTFLSSRPVPPGEIPNVVATATDVVPRSAPLPVTATPDMAMMRRAAVPSQLIPNTFAKLPKPNATRNLGDSLGMNPIQGGKQQAPMFDAAYDTTTGAMRLVQPVNTQGMGTFATAPKPATMSPQLAGRRSTDPVLQAALNAKYPAQRTAVNVPLPPGSPFSASDLARSKSGISTVATYPTAGARPLPSRPTLSAAYNPLTAQQKLALMGGGSAALPQIPGPAGSINNNKDQARLAPNAEGVGGIQTALLPYPQPASNRPAQRPFPAPPVQVASIGKVAPTPLPRPNWMPAVATQLAITPPRVAPVPRNRPNFGMGGPILQNPQVQGLAPVPRQRPNAFQAPQQMFMQNNPIPTSYINMIRGQLGVSSADAYRIANASNSPISLEDRITGRGSSSGGGAQSLSSI